MARKEISRGELAAWMTKEIQRFEGCEEVEVGKATPLQQPDSDGVNWSASLTLRATGVPQEIVNPALQKVLSRARANFNIKDD